MCKMIAKIQLYFVFMYFFFIVLTCRSLCGTYNAPTITVIIIGGRRQVAAEFSYEKLTIPQLP